MATALHLNGVYNKEKTCVYSSYTSPLLSKDIKILETSSCKQNKDVPSMRRTSKSVQWNGRLEELFAQASVQ